MKKKKENGAGGERPGQGRRDRYIQPSVLLCLHQGESYGYELIQRIQEFGFIKGDAPPGMVYRHLRRMEEEGLVSSQWETDEAGPAKRMYRITGDGEEVLGFWVGYMEEQARKLADFIATYRSSG